MLAEISAYGDSIEELNDICENLVEISAYSKARDQTIEPQMKYSKLLTDTQGKDLPHIQFIPFFHCYASIVDILLSIFFV